MSKYLSILSVLLVLSQLTACGQKGPLFIPEDADATAASEATESTTAKKKKPAQ